MEDGNSKDETKDKEIKVISVFNANGKTLNENIQEWIDENFFWALNDNIKNNKM